MLAAVLKMGLRLMRRLALATAVVLPPPPPPLVLIPSLFSILSHNTLNVWRCSAAEPVVETMHMVPGDGDTSYARNSTTQSGLQCKLKPMIEEAVASLLKGDDGATANEYCGGMAIADLGCSSGPNTLVLVSTAVDAVRRRCSELQQQPPELCIHLNDLPSNDFNLVIRNLATYIKTQESFSPVLTNIVPGSFHGRLFNKRSLHLVCSATSLHWLSKAPEDLVRNGIPFYDRDEAVRRARRSTVIKAYARQFNDDFTRILQLRAQEMVAGGRMVFSLLGQHSDEKPETESAILFLDFANAILREMASKSLIDNEKLDSFYIPLYAPSEKELREIIEAEGSFSIDKMAVHESPPQIVAPKTGAREIRAVMEPIITQHFRSSADAMDEFLRITEKLIEMSPSDAFPCKSTAFVAASLTRRT